MTEKTPIPYSLRSSTLQVDEPTSIHRAPVSKPKVSKPEKNSLSKPKKGVKTSVTLPSVIEETPLSSVPQAETSFSYPKTSQISTPPTSQVSQEGTTENSEKIIEELANNLASQFEKLGCNEQSDHLTQQKTTVSDTTLYPLHELSKMTDEQEVSISESHEHKSVYPSAPPPGAVPTKFGSFFSEMKEAATDLGYGSNLFAHDHPPYQLPDQPQMFHSKAFISDSVLSPKPFTGISTEDPEAWLEYFERYATYRNINDRDKAVLFAMFMRETAADWLSTLPGTVSSSYQALRKAFVEKFFKSRELLWKEAGNLFNQTQRPDERVDDFVTRLKKCAKRLNITEDVLHYAVLHGLRGTTRLQAKKFAGNSKERHE